MPDHDLVALWEAHCRHEFETHDVDATMTTMIEAPYVNNVPTMTGGVGRDQVKRFYKYHFIDGNAADTEVTTISRTVGADQIVDEVLFAFTHTREIDWMLPGIAPTGRRVEVPLVAVVHFKDGKIAHEPSTGTRPRCWCRSASSIPRACRSQAGKPRASSSTGRGPATG